MSEHTAQTATTRDRAQDALDRVPPAGRLLHVGAELGRPGPGPSSPFSPRGTEPRRRTLALISAIAEAGRVQAVITSTRRDAVPLAVSAGVPVRPVRGDRADALITTAAVVRAAAATAATTHVHLDGRAPLPTMLAAALASSAPVVVHLAASVASPVLTGDPSRLVGRIAGATLESQLLRRAALVIAPTPRLAELATDAGATSVLVVPPAVLRASDTPRPASAPPPPAPVMLPTSGPVVLAIGALSRRWSQTCLLSVLRAHPDVHVVVLGDGSTREITLRRAREAAVADRLHVHPRVSWQDVERAVAQADMVVSLPRGGEDPAAVLLAQAAGRPVVASRGDGMALRIADGVDGLLVGTNDDSAATEAVLGLLDDRTTAAALGAAAARRSAASDWSLVADAVLAASGAV